MAIRLPPILQGPIFNTAFFTALDTPLTIEDGDGRYLLYPISQGSETINGDLTTTGNTITNGTTTSTGKLTATNGLEVGVGAIASMNNIESVSGTLNIQTSGTGNIEMGLDTATSGNTVFRGQNINFIAYNSVQIEATNAFWTNIGASNFYYRAYSGVPQIIMGDATLGVDYGVISVGNAGMTIESYSRPMDLVGTTVGINQLATGNTVIGNGTGTISMNGAQLRPIQIGTYASQSSYSTTSSTPVRTFLGGTLETTRTFTNWATTSLFYVMAGITPYGGAGGLSLTAGTYMVAFAFNADNTVAFVLSDIRMGIGSVSTLVSGSTEAQYVAGTFNRTCYYHRTDATDAAASDTDNLGFTGMFRIGATTTVYPWLRLNTSVSPIPDVIVDVIITKLGSG